MVYLFNLLNLLVLLLLSPYILYKACTTGKHRRGMRAKFLGAVDVAPSPAFTVWFHGVSVGEIHLLRQVIAQYRTRHPEHRLMVSTTTDTGFDEAKKWFPDLAVIYWPLDFSWAIHQVLDRVRPDWVVLAESEVWPNFVAIAKRRGVRLALLNARMSPRSARRWQQIRWLAQRWFARIDIIGAQTEEYAQNFRRLGAPRVMVTGNVKYDGVTCDRRQPKTQAMRTLFSVGPQDLVWIAGSTQAPEEEVVLGIFQRARQTYPQLRLFLVPRQKERFDEVARLLEKTDFLRRSQWFGPGEGKKIPPIVLVDTFGELNALWGLADIAYVGGSLDGQRGGQNMIEPAGYGAAVTFGPHTWNFKHIVEQLLQNQAALKVDSAQELETTTLGLFADTDLRHRLGAAAQRFVLSQQGATEKNLDALDEMMQNPAPSASQVA